MLEALLCCNGPLSRQSQRNLAHYNWIGFYMLDPEDASMLVLGPFHGEPTPHVHICQGRNTAAGSCGFTVHSIFHVWGEVFTARGPNQWQAQYAGTHVYGIDFDPRSVKIAKALNTIAGDGKTNVYRANTLDTKMWSEDTRAGLRSRLRRFKNSADDQENQKTFRYFDFDVLLTNPPFAGDIKDNRILSQYDLAKNNVGKWEKAVGRDILFIERNLQFLRPGGRAAIVLPQGRFNNSGDERIRRWIAERARVLAIVGLHGNTFKPHTGTKTSVLFIQTWNDDKKAGPFNPRLDDYPVFMATSEKPGKGNNGDYIYRIGVDNAPVLDEHHHMVVEHDLDEIADAFAKWARKQKLRSLLHPSNQGERQKILSRGPVGALWKLSRLS